MLFLFFFLFTGRARHPNGVMITFLDQELSNQEEKNDHKEGLMNKALDSIQGASVQY